MNKKEITIPKRVRILNTPASFKAMTDHCISVKFAHLLQGRIVDVIDYCFDSPSGLILKVQGPVEHGIVDGEQLARWWVWVPPKAYARVKRAKKETHHAKPT